ncbi:hypothetical protein SRRS_52370 [Sporomusa rhizae]
MTEAIGAVITVSHEHQRLLKKRNFICRTIPLDNAIPLYNLVLYSQTCDHVPLIMPSLPIAVYGEAILTVTQNVK